MIVYATHEWRDNAALIEAVASLGYLRAEWRTLDPTWGLGRFWKRWRPTELVGSDLNPAKSPTGTSVDFTALPHADRSFDVLVFDPPYKLNGRPTAEVDGAYGVDEWASVAARHELIRRGLTKYARVASRYVLLKCQDQVNAGRVRWQTIEFTNYAQERCGLTLVDRFDMIGGRAQPSNRTRKHEECDGKGSAVCDNGRLPSTQKHARRNTSTLLVFEVTERDAGQPALALS